MSGRKKFLAIIYVLAAFLIALPLAGLATEGDLDGDGVTNAADAAILFRMATGVSDAVWDADITQNGTVTRADVRAVLLHASGRLPDFPVLRETLQSSLLGEEALDLFSYSGPVKTDTGYRSKTISATVTETEFQNSVCYVLDIYTRDVTCFRSAFASGEYGGKRQKAEKIAAGCGAVYGITGDMYEMNAGGAFVRNGVWYNEKKGVTKKKDLCALYTDGTMEVFEKGSVNLQTLQSGKEIWQLWVFGPSLLDENGETKSEFNCNEKILDNNPRSAIGYYGPGHYCLVVVDGRQRPYSSGLRMEDLSDFMSQLGCAIAYNLDGGQSAVMVDGSGNTISSPSGGGRVISDIVYIGEPVA